jgi:RNA recognition motif-containing protein
MTTRDQLRLHMETSGLRVTMTDILKHPDGSSKCCALVTFSTARAVKEAIHLLHGTMLDNRYLLVKEDEPRSQRGYYQGTRAPVNPKTSIFVSNLPYHMNQQQLFDHFATAPGLVSLKLYSKSNSGQHFGKAMLVYEDPDSAANAILKFEKSFLHERILNMRYCNPD